MTSERVIKEAPVPVRWGWIIDGWKAPSIWNEQRDIPVESVLRGVDEKWTLVVTLSNGQTVIVRAKK